MNNSHVPTTRQLVAASLGAEAKTFILDQVVVAAQAGAISPDHMSQVLQFCDQAWQPEQKVSDWLDSLIPGLSAELAQFLNQQYQATMDEQGWQSVEDILAEDQEQP